MSFEWRTDDQDAWPEADGIAADAGVDSPRWLRLRLLATLLLLAATGCLFAFRQARVRVTKATTIAEQELLATDALLRDAAVAGDKELIAAILPDVEQRRGSSAPSRVAQVPLDRAAYGFYLNADAVRETPTETWLSPDLQHAVVTYTLPYTVVEPSGTVTATALQHSIHYRRGDGRWTWVEPDDDYWGEWITDETDEQFLVVYPERDAIVGARLARDLRRQRASLCAAFGGCPHGLRLQFRMEREYATLRQVRRALDAQSGLLTTAVAAPSAIGVPQDEAGYQALLRGYLRLLSGALLQQLVNEASSARGAYGDALLQRVLVDLGLLPWPPQGEANNRAQVPPPGILYTLCSDGMTQGASLYRVDLKNNRWEPVIGGRHFVNMVALAGTDALLLQETMPDDRGGRPQLFLVRDGVPIAHEEGLVLSATGQQTAVVYAYDENQEQLVLNYQGADACGDAPCDVPRIYASDAAWSPDGKHTLLRRPQEGSKSPPVGGEMLYLADRNGLNMRPLAPGYNPFWLDNDTYGYVQLEFGDTGTAVGTNAVVLSDVATFQPRIIVERAYLEDFVITESAESATQLFIGYVNPDPSYAGRLRLMAGLFRSYNSFAQYDLYFFSADIASGEVRLDLALAEQILDERPVRSVDGWLAFASSDLHGQSTTLTVYDEVKNETAHYGLASGEPDAQTRLPSIGLSPDQKWLFFLEEGVLRLIRPSDGVSRRIVPPFPGCAVVAWPDS
jgi:hypothetical protein